MIKIENIEVFNFDSAMRGCRNPLESWDKSDSYIDTLGSFILGENDEILALRLIKAGSDHSKFLRQIFVSMDITTAMSVWWDIDTYKVATVRNSTSRMHKLGSRLLTHDDFSWDNEAGDVIVTKLRLDTLADLNDRIVKMQNLRFIRDVSATIIANNLFRDIVLDLPDSYNFLSTYTCNYEMLRNFYHARKNHKQREIREMCQVIEKLPYSQFITIEK